MLKMTLFSKRVIILVLVCLETTFVSCKDKITKIELINKNPVEYTFNSSKDGLYNLLKQLRINEMKLYDATHGNIVLDEISELFLRPQNKLDFCLMPLYYICKSKIYQSKTETPWNIGHGFTYI